jgi:hypothetical protein
MSPHAKPRLGILARGDAQARATTTPQNSRLKDVFAALAEAGVEAKPIVYSEEVAGAVGEQLAQLDGVLVWVDPLSDNRTRENLDTLLRAAAARGVWVSAHPDVILKMGVKDVLFRTRHLGWGTDVRVYRSAFSFRDEFPGVLRSGEARVIKQNRGNGGQGIWKVQRLSRAADGPSVVRVLEARRGSRPENLSLNEFVQRCEGYFSREGCIIDQPFQPRLKEGMIRCYVSGDRVVGYGHQLITALLDPPDDPAAPPLEPGPRIMHPATAPAFQALRTAMESEWIPGLMRSLNIAPASLPAIWDADFLYGPRSSFGEDTYVLCEINVSCVSPFPDDAPLAIARRTLACVWPAQVF